MRTIGVLVALTIYVLAVPAGIRAEQAARVGSMQRLLWESARCLLAVAAATALFITALWAV